MISIERKLDAAMRVLQKTDQIITGHTKLRVTRGHPHSAHLANAPAWTDGGVITFNVTKYGRRADGTPPDLTRSLLRNLIGVNYHEVAHVLYTPFDLWYKVAGSFFGDTLKMFIFNVLEDQRIERLFVSRYEVAEDLFTNLVTDLLVNLRGGLQNVDDGLWLLVCGRHYLPQSLRDGAKAMFEPSGHADEIESLVRQYQRLILTPSSESDVRVIVDRIHTIITKPSNESGMPSGSERMANGDQASGVGHWPDRPERGGPDDSEKTGRQRRDGAKADSQDADAQHIESHDVDYDDMDGDNDEEQEQVDSNDGDVGQDGQGETSGEAASDDHGSDNTDESSSDTPGGESAGSDSPDVNDWTSDEITSELFQAQSEAQDSEVASEHLDEIFESIRQVMSQGKGVDTERIDGSPVSATGDDRMASKKIVRVFGDLRVQAEGAWEPDRLGRPNISRIMQAEAGERFLREPFDSFQDNDYATRINMAVALDISGSMAGMSSEVARAAWLLKRSVDQVGGDCVVYAYNTESFIVYDVGDKAKSGEMLSFKMRGGTDPGDCLSKSAHWLLSRDSDSIRMMVTVTDGHWASNRGDEVIQSMNRAGVTWLQCG
jgi:hypothetical protein